MRASFDQSLKRILVHEGGWSNRKSDPGGATMYGVTQRVYDGYRKNRKLEQHTVRKISMNEVGDIYRTLYANKIRFDDLPRGIDYVVLDGAVNSGPSQSTKWIQRATGRAKADGNLDEATIAAIRAYPDHDQLIAKVLSYRLGFLQNLKIYGEYGAGWRRRLADVLRGGQAWATGSVPTPAEALAAQQGAGVKAVSKETTELPGEDAAPVITATGTVTTGIVETTRQQLEPLAWSGGQWIQNILIALVAIGIIMTVGGLVWNWWIKRKKAKIEAAMNAQVYSDVFELEEVQEPPAAKPKKKRKK